MVLTMELAGILMRIESRLIAVGLSATKASKLAGKPDAIRNIRRAVTQTGKEGRRRGISSATIHALAPVLQTTPEWILTGKNGGENGASATAAAAMAIHDETLTIREMVDGLTWAFQELEKATEAEAHMLAVAVATVIRMPLAQSGEPPSEQERRNLIEIAVRLFRAKEL